MRLDFGDCENCTKKSATLNSVIHQPTGVVMFVCNQCYIIYKESLDNGQMPGKLGDKLKKYLDGLL